MAFPSLTITEFTESAVGTTRNITNPATVSGQLLIYAIASLEPSVGGPVVTMPAGYIQLATVTQNFGRFTLFYRVATGSESGASVAVGTAASAWVAVQILQFNDWDGTNLPEISASAGALSSFPGTESLTPSWGADDTLWISIINHVDDVAAVSIPIPDYTAVVQTDSGLGTTNNVVGVITQTRELNATSEDPANFSLDQPEAWCGWTIGVQGGAFPLPSTGAGTISDLISDSVTDLIKDIVI